MKTGDLFVFGGEIRVFIGKEARDRFAKDTRHGTISEYEYCLDGRNTTNTNRISNYLSYGVKELGVNILDVLEKLEEKL